MMSEIDQSFSYNMNFQGNLNIGNIDWWAKVFCWTDDSIECLENSSNWFAILFPRVNCYSSDKSELTDVNQAIDDLKKYLEYDPDDVAALNLLNVLQ